MAKKTQLGYQEIEKRLRLFKEQAIAPDDVPYRLLYCFGKTDADIRRWQEGKGVVKSFDGLLIKNLIAYRTSSAVAMTADLEQMKSDPRVLAAKPKIAMVSDGEAVLAYDLREQDTYENRLQGLYCDFNFFYPLADVERVHNVEESPADVKAAEKLAKLHDEIRAYNEFTSDTDLHDLNIFISRLLFCYFAEDTGIFPDNLFTNSIKSYTLDDGSDLSSYLSKAFEIMDLPQRDRPKDVNSIVGQFPYVNGGLFSHHIQIPNLSARARKIMIDCGSLNWQEINPDIFGSMIQAVVNPEERANQGMHYTSVPNILKVINPLFLDELKGEFKKIEDFHRSIKERRDLSVINSTQYVQECKPVLQSCRNLLKRISKMKFFDPACGSGNFLIITYKELRLLEMNILRIMQECTIQYGLLTTIDSSVVNLNQFYGIELLDFPHEVAMLSLWLAQHQMNRKLMKDFGINTHALPLQNITQIKCGNACRMDWNEVCPHTKDEEVYVFGNPPYLGVSLQTLEQKNDMKVSIGKYKGYKKIDYIGVWFIKGAEYIKKTKSKCAFVSTNSICQGEIVEPLWTAIYKSGVNIDFAYTSFKWKNNARKNAAVICVIVGLSCINKQKVLFVGNEKRYVNSISPYLTDGAQLVVSKQTKPISSLPIIIRGCMPYDGGNLILSLSEKNELTSEIGNDKYVKELYSAADYIKGNIRYCLWISDEDEKDALKYSSIYERVEKTKKMRLSSSDEGANALAEKPYQFREFISCEDSTLVIPSTSSENRIYIPMGYANNQMVVTNAMYMIRSCPVWVFGVCSSSMSMVWMKTIGGKLKTDYRYTSLCYNTFPFPKLTEKKKLEIEAAAEDVLLTREDYPGATLADLYDPDKMPKELLEAHQKLDDVVESCYPGYPFANDEARLECLFKLYEKMTKTKK